jgi:hypothetical protein
LPKPGSLFFWEIVSSKCTGAFEVEFSRKGGSENMHWVGGQGGPGTVMDEEPYASTVQKLTVGILKWLPIDSQL